MVGFYALLIINTIYLQLFHLWLMQLSKDIQENNVPLQSFHGLCLSLTITIGASVVGSYIISRPRNCAT